MYVSEENTAKRKLSNWEKKKNQNRQHHKNKSMAAKSDTFLL